MTAPDGTGDPAAKPCPKRGRCTGLLPWWSCRSRAPPWCLCRKLRPHKLQMWGEQGVVGLAPLCFDACSWCPPDLTALCMGNWDKRVSPKMGWDSLPPWTGSQVL